MTLDPRPYGRGWGANAAPRFSRPLPPPVRAASRARVISIRLPEDDIELARQQASRKGLAYQTYIKSVLHQALRQANEP
jgi:hypothetical protein